MLLLLPDRLNKNTYKYTIWFTVLRLMEASIFIKKAISNSIHLQKKHAPVYFCYLPSSKKPRNLYPVYQLSSLIPLFFPILPQIFGIQKENHAWVLSTKCPLPNQCATQVCQCPHSNFNLRGYLLLMHMTALKKAPKVSEATERTHTSLIFFYPACKLVFKVDLLVAVKICRPNRHL